MTKAVTGTDSAGAKLMLEGYLKNGEQLHRNVLLDRMVEFIPRDSSHKVQIYNAEIAPGGYTGWHCHNGATFFLVLQGFFEAEFEDGVGLRAESGDVYSEPIGKVHRGHNPHAEIPFLCIGFCITASDLEHVTNFEKRPW